MSLKFIFAHTDNTDAGYPSYVNISATEEGRIVITTRDSATSDGAGPVVGATAQHTLPKELSAPLVDALTAHLGHGVDDAALQERGEHLKLWSRVAEICRPGLGSTFNADEAFAWLKEALAPVNRGKLKVAHHPFDHRFTVGYSNEDEAGGFTVVGDITDQVDFIRACLKDAEKHTGLTFGAALTALKEGYRVAREGWNVKGMWIGLVKADNYIVFTAPHGDGQDTPEGECKGLLPWLGMKTADNKFVPWLASQTDMLADDWMLVLPEY